MSDHKQRYQFAVLVDVAIFCKKVDELCTVAERLSAVKLALLRILSTFSNRLSSSHSTCSNTGIHNNSRKSCLSNVDTLGANKSGNEVHWGFKFFNSESNENIFERNCGFSDFDLPHFEKFEKKLQDKIEKCQYYCQKGEINVEEKCCCGRATPSRHTKNVNDAENGNDTSRLCKCKKKRHPSSSSTSISSDVGDKIQKCLQEVLHDFQWDRPSILSPVKRNKSTAIEQHENFTLIFASSPRTIKDVKNAFDCDAEPSALLKNLMKPLVRTQWQRSSKIKLLWMDTSCFFNSPSLSMEEMPDFSGFKLMRETLKLVSGDVVPVNAIIQMGSCYSAVVNSMLQCIDYSPKQKKRKSFGTQKKSSPCSLPFPTSMILPYYTSCLSTQSTQCDFDCNIIINGDGEDQVVFPVHIENCSLANKSHRAHSKSEIFDLHLENPDGRYAMQVSCMKVSEEKDSEKHTATVEALGVMSVGDLSLHSYESDDLSIITSRAINTNEDELFSLSCLLSELAEQQLVMICQITRPGGLPCLAVLKPLTVAMASIIHLNLSISSSVWKILYLTTPETPTEELGMTKHLKSWVRHERRHLIGLSPESQGLSSYPEQSSHVTYNSTPLENWYDPNVTAVNDNILSDVTESCETHDTSQKREASILKKLQKLHIKVESNKFGGMMKKNPLVESQVISDLKKSPRRSPRKQKLTPAKSDLHFTPRKSKLRRCKTPRKSAQKKSILTPRKVVRMTPGKRKSSPKKSSLKGTTPRKAKSNSFFSTEDGSGRQLNASEKRQALKQKRNYQMLTKGRQKALEKQDVEIDDDTGTLEIEATKQQNYQHMPVIDLPDEAALGCHIQDLYTKIVTGESPLQSTLGMIMLSAERFFSAEKDDAKILALKWLKQEVALSGVKLREKYYRSEEQCDKEFKCQEYELQILLQTDIAAQLLDIPPPTENDEGPENEDIDKVVQMIVGMLRALSFLKDLTYLTTFLNEIMMQRYFESSPRLLGLIYDELMQPMPPQLANLLSPESSAASFALQESVPPPSNMSDLGSQPASHCLRDRKLIRHPSFNVVPQRQIEVTFQKPKCEVKKARRNLFASSGKGSQASSKGRGGVKLERRQSVAVMQCLDTRKSSKSTVSKAHHVLKTKAVCETPSHKQKRNSVWRRQEKERRRTQTVPEITVVQESPNKPGGKVIPETSLKRRNSFYTSGSDNTSSSSRAALLLAKLESRLTNSSSSGKSPELSGSSKGSGSVFGKQLHVSPVRRVQPKVVFSQLLSPSPLKPFVSKPVTPEKIQQWVRQLTFETPNKSSGTSPTPTKRAGFDSPSSNTRAHSRLLSPSKAHLHNAQDLGSPVRRSPRVSTSHRPMAVAVRRKQLFSPNENRSVDGKESCTPKKMGTTNFTEDKSTASKVVGTALHRRLQRVKSDVSIHSEHSDSEHNDQAPKAELLTTSPRRSTRQHPKLTEQMMLNSPEKSENANIELFASDQTKCTQSTHRDSPIKAPSILPETKIITPCKNKRVRTPDSLDKWPRKKPRAGMEHFCPPLEKSAKIVTETEVNDNCPELRRKIGSCRRRTSMRSHLLENTVRSDSEKENVAERTVFEAANNTKAEKDNGLYDFLSQDNVFSSSSQFSSRVDVSGEDNPVKRTDCEISAKSNTDNYSSNEDTIDGSSSSPEFVSPTDKNIRRTISGISECNSDSNFSMPSPVFNSPSHHTDKQQSNNTPPCQNTLCSPPFDFRKFSPNLGHSSVMSLETSPMVNWGLSRTQLNRVKQLLDTGENKEVAGQSPRKSSNKKSSRRSLYRAQTSSQL